MVGAADSVVGQGEFWGTGRDEIGVEQESVVKVAAGKGDIVDDGEHGAPAGDPGADQAEEFARGPQIEAGEGFVEQENIRALGESAGEEDALLLTAGKGVQRAISERGEIEFSHGFGDPRMVGDGKTAEEAKRGQPALLDHGAYMKGEIPVYGLALREVGETRQGVARVGVADANLAGSEHMPAEESAHKGAFTRTVGTADGRGAAAGQIGANRAQGRDTTALDGDIAKADNVVFGGVQMRLVEGVDERREELP